MRFARHEALPALADALDHVWLLDGAGDGEQPIWPDGCGEWVFQLADPFEQLQADGSWQRQPTRLLVGQQLRRVLLRPGRRVRCLGLHFRPEGMACFLAGDLRRFTDRIVELDAALDTPLDALRASLQQADDANAAAAVQHWLSRLRRAPAEPRLQRAVAALQQPGCELPALASELGWSERQLRRRFESAVGLAPKRYARLARFQQVLGAGRLHDAQAWAAAAQDAGYCDQSHFNRDFRAFTGSAPRQLLSSLQPLTDFFLGMSENSKTPT